MYLSSSIRTVPSGEDPLPGSMSCARGNLVILSLIRPGAVNFPLQSPVKQFEIYVWYDNIVADIRNQVFNKLNMLPVFFQQ